VWSGLILGLYVQHYKSLCAVVTICAAMVNIQIDTQTAFWSSCMNSSVSWGKNSAHLCCAMLTCEMKLFQCFISHVTIFTSISHVWNWNKIISVTAEDFQNYFGDNEHVGKYSRAAISLWNNSEIIPGKFPHAEIKLFQTGVNEGWNYFEIIFFQM